MRKTSVLAAILVMVAYSSKAQWTGATLNTIPKAIAGSALGNTSLSDNGTSLITTNAHFVFNPSGGHSVINWGNGSGDLIFRRLSTGGNINPGSFSTLMTIKYDGKLGLGVTSPVHKFHVDNGAIYVSGTNSYGGAMILLGGTQTTPNQWGIESTSTGLNFWRPSGATPFGNYYMFLKNSNGNVGIKTDNPTADLTVNGSCLIGDPATISLPALGTGYRLYVQTGILTEKVKVAVETTADWADYVFEKNYKMMALSEVETYVKKNKHLPGVPSAEEVVKEGVDLTKMDAKLLEKIEELTLYVIELEKKINEIKAK